MTSESEQKTMEVDVAGLDEIKEDDTTTIKLLCGKNHQPVVVVKKFITGLSVLVKTAFEQDPTATEFPIESVEPEAFRVIQQYVEYHKGVPGEIIPYPAKSTDMKVNCKDPWDAEFVDKLWNDVARRQLFFCVVTSANYLNIQCLLHLMCCKVGTMIHGTPYDKLKSVLMGDTAQSEEKKSN